MYIYSILEYPKDTTGLPQVRDKIYRIMMYIQYTALRLVIETAILVAQVKIKPSTIWSLS